ncbi:MAG: type II toxin-antitoxin system death-on-curing family toxin [Candidatus Dormibacteria bacterium]
MKPKPIRVRDLADRADLDLDECLIRLWEGGLDRFVSGGDVVRRGETSAAFRAVGLEHVGSGITQCEYWERLLRLTRVEFDELCASLGIVLSPSTRRLPKGAIKKLRRRWPPPETTILAAPSLIEPQVPAGEKCEFTWTAIGRHPSAGILSADVVSQIHWSLVEDFKAEADPIDPPGERSQDLLESAVFRPMTALGEEAKYPTLELSAAALLHSLVHDHPFHNGNKRTALVTLLVQLDREDMTITCSEADLFKFILRVAQHSIVPRGPDLPDREVAWIAKWICDNSRDVDRTERTLRWHKLKGILKKFECELNSLPGSRMNITRAVASRGIFRRNRTQQLRTQVYCGGDATEADRNTIRKVRFDLQLDDDHGVDSVVFYRAEPSEAIADFIARYRKTLKRLASL